MKPRVPLRWPAAWDSAKLLSLLDRSPFNCILAAGDPTTAKAREAGFEALASPPRDVVRIEGEWPGAKVTTPGTADAASAGPTGAPWVDSNLPSISLALARKPGAEIWIDAAPAAPRLTPASYLMGVADAAAWGATWVVQLDDRLAAGIASANTEALRTWDQLKQAANFFSARNGWLGYRPDAVLGIVSDFEGPNEFFSRELINLTSRTGQQFRPIPLKAVNAAALLGLKTVIYADAEPPAAAARTALTGFAESGGLLIAGPKWGSAKGVRLLPEQHPRFTLIAAGKGRVALAKDAFDEPYLAANDSVVLTSHRHDLLRFWNAGAFNAQKTISPDGRHALVQMMFYAGARGGDPTLWVAGRYRSAKLWTPDVTGPRETAVHTLKDGVEVHLPAVGPYVAVELEIA